MLVFGYIFYKNSDKDKISKCAFNTVECYRNNNQVYPIKIPNFTAKEIQEINKGIPDGRKFYRKLSFLNKDDIKDYLKIYRLLPHYRETGHIQ